MTNTIASAAPEGPSFHRFCERASELEPGDFEGTESLIREAQAAGLSNAQTRHLMVLCEKSTGLDAAVIRTMRSDVSTEHAEHGRLSTPDDAAYALGCDLEKDFGPILHADGAIHAYQAEPSDDEYGIYLRLSPETLNDRLLSYPTAVAGTKWKRDEILSRLAAKARADDAFVNAPPGLALMSGFLSIDPDSLEIRHISHSPEHLARNKIDVVYSPTASARETRKMLLRTFGGDETKMQTFVEFLSCAVFRQMPANDASRTGLILVGPQRSGKSTVIRLTQAFFLEEQVTSLAPDLWGKPENLLQLAGCALNTVTELQTRQPIKGNIVKQVLSREPVAARRMRQNLFTFTPSCVNIWACNELPKLDEQHPSLVRRFIILSMGQTLTDAEVTEDFWGTLGEEAAGFVNYLAESFVRVMQRGHFVLPADSDLLVGRMQFGDRIAPLFARHCLEARPGARANSEDLQRELRSFAASLDMDPAEAVHSGTMKELASIMAAQFGATRKKVNGRPFYLGVGVNGPRPGDPPMGDGDRIDDDLADL